MAKIGAKVELNLERIFKGENVIHLCYETVNRFVLAALYLELPCTKVVIIGIEGLAPEEQHVYSIPVP